MKKRRRKAIGKAIRKESMRSSRPPWPGIQLPESLNPYLRLSFDSIRSPIVPKMHVDAARSIQMPRL